MINFGLLMSGGFLIVGVVIILLAFKVLFSHVYIEMDETRKEFNRIVNKIVLTLFFVGVIVLGVAVALNPLTINRDQTPVGSSKQIELNMAVVKEDGNKAVAKQKEIPRQELLERDKETENGYNDFLNQLKKERESK